MKDLLIVEFPSNLGLKEPVPGKEPGVKHLPDWLRKFHLHHLLQPEDSIRLGAPAYHGSRDAETGLLNADSIASYAIAQAGILYPLLAKNKFPFIIGGDCSILLGAAVAMKQHGNYGLFYLDGHTDFMDVSLSSTGGVGGMAASMAAGKGHKKMTDILGRSPYIQEENVWCVGNREYDDAYEDEIRNSNATYLSLAMLREEGLENCVHRFLKEAEQKNLDGFWIHIDVDVLDDAVMPCVDSRTPDGLSYEEFNTLTFPLFSSPMLKGLEITILDPDLDPEGQYTPAFVENITANFKKARS